MTKNERALAVVRLLKQAYPDAICALQYQKDYELLFATRLSAQCTDARVNLVTKDLFVRFPSLQSFAEAPLEEIEEGIKTCGLFRTISALRFRPFDQNRAFALQLPLQNIIGDPLSVGFHSEYLVSIHAAYMIRYHDKLYNSFPVIGRIFFR